MRVNDQQVTFNFLKVLKCANDIEECQAISLLDFVVEEEFEKEYKDKDNGESNSIDSDDEEPLGHHNELMESKLVVDRPGKRFDTLKISARTFIPSKSSMEGNHPYCHSK